MTPDQLKKTLRLHTLYLQGDSAGVKADLTSANLRGADLTSADLTGANLRGANLRGANLTSADLTSATLTSADLTSANLRGADLTSADLTGATLTSANLTSANLRGADLRGADLTSANLRGADLTSADLTSANLRGADLTSADLTSATLPRFQIPQEGSLIVYKRLNAADGATRVIAKLMVPSAAKRTATPIGRKCRAKYAKVLGMVVRGTNTKVDVAYSTHQRTFEYRVGQVVRPDKYDDDIRVECTSGVHFFLTKEEAEEY